MTGVSFLISEMHINEHVSSFLFKPENFLSQYLITFHASMKTFSWIDNISMEAYGQSDYHK